MARAIELRYCTEQPYKYSEIAKILKVSPEHARRLTNRAVGYLSDDQTRQRLYRSVEEGSRLWEAVERQISKRRSRPLDSS